jgi:hypothetical protein
MKVIKYGIFLLLLTFPLYISFFLVNQPKVPAPFFDGMFLEISFSESIITYEVNVLDNDGYKIIKTDKWKDTGKAKAVGAIEEYHVDRYGIVYKSSFKNAVGRFSPIWIPVHEIGKGDKIDRRRMVLGKQRWKGRRTLVIEDEPTGAFEYYDLNTGLLAGAFATTAAGESEFVLVKTNADMPDLPPHVVRPSK